MMRHYEIPRIEGLPPKKDGSKSVWHKWQKKLEIDRLVILRRTVFAIMRDDKSLTRDIHLTVRLYTGRHGLEAAGDLDNFLGGICDGLMSHRCDTSHCDPWNNEDYADIHPSQWKAIENDKAIVSIHATKTASEGDPWYSIELEGC